MEFYWSLLLVSNPGSKATRQSKEGWWQADGIRMHLISRYSMHTSGWYNYLDLISDRSSAHHLRNWCVRFGDCCCAQSLPPSTTKNEYIGKCTLESLHWKFLQLKSELWMHSMLPRSFPRELWFQRWFLEMVVKVSSGALPKVLRPFNSRGLTRKFQVECGENGWNWFGYTRPRIHRVKFPRTMHTLKLSNTRFRKLLRFTVQTRNFNRSLSTWKFQVEVFNEFKTRTLQNLQINLRRSVWLNPSSTHTGPEAVRLWGI